MLIKQLSTLQYGTMLMVSTHLQTHVRLFCWGHCHCATIHVVSLSAFSVPFWIVGLSEFSGWALVVVRLQRYP